MRTKIYVYGLCNVFYDSYYIQGLKEIYNDLNFNISKFPNFRQGTFAFILENNNSSKKIIIDSKDSNQIDINELEWCDIYGKANYSLGNSSFKNQEKVIAIGPSFGIKIWNFFFTFYYLVLNYCRFRHSLSNKREFIANYWRQYKRFTLKKYAFNPSSRNEVFFMNSIWKQEPETNKNRALFIELCKNDPNVTFEGGFAARKDGDNLGFDNMVYSKRVSLKKYIERTKNSAFVFNTPAVLSCHGWKLAEFLALGKAIITTSHCNQFPESLINNKHLLYVTNRNEMERAIEKLINNIDYKRQLERESTNYFNEYLAPKKVIKRLVEEN